MNRHDHSHDQLRRELRSLRAADAAGSRRSLLGRRDVLRIGGFTVATAAVISACGEHARGEVGRVGAVPSTVKLPDAIVDNAVLLRTASSMEHSTIDVYDQIIGNSDLLDPKYNDVAKRFRDDHLAHAELLEKLTTGAGGTPWACSNPKFDDVVVIPVMTRITVGAAGDVDVGGDPSERRSAPRHPQLHSRPRSAFRRNVPGVRCPVLRAVLA